MKRLTERDINGTAADINNALFPSLKPGDHIDIDGACRRFGI